MIMLPLDLHVLSLPLAFILSQDQTLHCKIVVCKYPSTQRYCLICLLLVQTKQFIFKKNKLLLLKNLKELFSIINAEAPLISCFRRKIFANRTAKMKCFFATSKSFGMFFTKIFHLVGERTINQCVPK